MPGAGRPSRIRIAFLAVGLSSVATSTTAAEFNEARVVQCMMDHSTADHEAVFKKLMIAVLTEDDGGVKSSLVQMTSRIMDLALTKCEVGISSLSTPAFQAAAKLYGQQMGEKMMKNAFAKLN
ncbi:hypothetical protein [Sinorhizobium alkalisoli]|uniref:Uncharacterized protein n=1 Tax=Sinorhizobium alkalisoli TaxID=1752398 RepID=A0A1E3VBI2_9HYPH|nr:hypothetical protein [Sinorhizobium alkalisoli]MCG5478194.1 hypothetical protein [Sinorhizobium alkalisoli]ODR90943.1 hypothetical protein A8M32_13070 [Sinorhizobium alkalisoli]